MGSKRFVYSAGGSVSETINYMPYGEYMTHSANTIDKFKFTGKERDTETNYDYFGARYYNNKLGLWNSVDPLKDKYPGWCPYNYVANNPLNFIDMKGDSISIVGDDPNLALDDLQSIVGDAATLSIGENNLVNIALPDGYKVGSNLTLDVMTTIINSSTMIGYGVSTAPIPAKNIDANGIVIDAGTANSSVTPLTESARGAVPPAGLDGQSIISTNVEWGYSDGSKASRSTIVGHELTEVYFRSHGKGMYYHDAHKLSNKVFYGGINGAIEVVPKPKIK